jgi:two-component system C4-dicarboxylate transport response regulator DctD
MEIEEESGFIGSSQASCGLREFAKKIASFPVDILINGETGVGKDQYARYIHTLSGRTGQFVAVNCAAIPDTLFESELFGSEIGAYTGAVRAREGKIQQANNGTLFLDEVESMPMSQQSKLLRVLQDHSYERLGGNRSYMSHFRVIAASKQNLPELVERERFREDLYFRLNVVEVVIPPLRNRISEAMPLLRHFLSELVSDAEERMRLLSQTYEPELVSQVLQHRWPGNVRELKSCARRMAIGLPILEMTPAISEEFSLNQAREEFERLMIEAALKHARGSVQKASAELSIPEQTLYYRMRKLNISTGEAGQARLMVAVRS